MKKNVFSIATAFMLFGCGGNSDSGPDFTPRMVPYGTYRGTWSEFNAPDTITGAITITFQPNGNIVGSSDIGYGACPVIGDMKDNGDVYIGVYLKPDTNLASVHTGRFQVSRDGKKLKGPLNSYVGDFTAEIKYDLKAERN